jgi:hypothetical protein
VKQLLGDGTNVKDDETDYAIAQQEMLDLQKEIKCEIGLFLLHWQRQMRIVKNLILANPKVIDRAVIKV